MHYAINFRGRTSEEGANDCTVTINNSDINGWGALNIWSHGLKLKATNSTFNGYNDKVYNSAGWNGFGTIVLEGDTTRETKKHAENCQLTFENCTIVSTSTTGNSQSPILFNLYSKNNTVDLNNCEFSYVAPNIFMTNNGTENKVKIDGNEITLGLIDSIVATGINIGESKTTATGTFVLTYNGKTYNFDLATVTGQAWSNGTDYVFKNYVIEGVAYSFDFDISPEYANGWTLYLGIA